jgi:hypothetical protein
MKTALTDILDNITLYKKANNLLLDNKDFEIIANGTFGANHWRLKEYEFEKYSVPFGRFWHSGHWIIKRNGFIVMRTPHYKYCIGLTYKLLGLI